MTQPKLDVRYGVIDECVSQDYESALRMIAYLRAKLDEKEQAASAQIAKIPLPLSSYIARTWKPKEL